MQLFETAWFQNYEYYERVYDTDFKKSIVRKFDNKYEFYEPSDLGTYKSILDDSVRLQKRLGYSKHAFGMYGVCSPIYRNIKDCYWSNHQFNMNPDVLYLDIETRAREFPNPDKASQEIVLIQMLDSFKNTVYVLGLKDWHSEPDYQFDYDVKYVKCDDEVQLLTNFSKLFKALNPLVVYAWNGEGFDFPYLYNRITNLGLNPSDILSFTGHEVKLKRIELSDRVKYSLQSPGHFFMDLMDLYKKFIKTPQRSYSLDAISRSELNDNKVVHSEYTSFDGFYTGEDYVIADQPYSDRIREKIRQLQIAKSEGKDYSELDKYTNFQFVYYGIYDVILLKKLDDKLHFTQIMSNLSSMMGVLFSDALGTVKPWAQYITNVALKDNLVMPPASEHELPNIVGGYVREPEVGRHQWVLNFDVNSMYPLLSMISFNMSAETYIPIYKLPVDLRDIILRYFNDQNEDARFKLDPEIWNTLTALLQKYHISMAINGACFSQKKQGIIPRLVQEIYTKRKKEKGLMLKYEQAKVKLKEILESGKFGNVSEVDDILNCNLEELDCETVKKYINICADQQTTYSVLQHTDKILINSLYGAQGNQYFPLFNEKVAQAITGNGRFFIKKTASYIDNFLQSKVKSNKPYIIYNDTDSGYYQLEPFVKIFVKKNPNATLEDKINFCDKFADKVIQPVIQKSVDDFAFELNAYNKDTIGAKREIIADAAIWVSKKKYIARVYDSEGTRYPLDHPKIKIMGLELIKSSTSKFAADKINDAIKILLDGNLQDIKAYISNVQQEFINAPLGDIATITSVNRLDYDLVKDKSVPIGSRAAIIYNSYISSNGLTGKYTIINKGDKVKRLYLKQPNKFMNYNGSIINADTIAFLQDEFAESHLRDYVDYDLCFEKFFMAPLKIMTNSLNYNLESSNSLDDW